MEQSGRGEELLQVPTASSGPGAAAASIPPLSPSHMFMQLREQGEIMSGRAEQQGQQETRAAYRNIMALRRFLKTHGHFSKLEAKKQWKLGLLAEDLSVNPGSVICCLCSLRNVSVSSVSLFLSFCVSLSLFALSPLFPKFLVPNFCLMFMRVTGMG